MAAVASASGGERPDTSPAMDVLSSKSATDAASDSSSSSFADLNDHSNIAPSPSREVDPHVFLLHFTPVLDQAAFFLDFTVLFFSFLQSQASARSEEYRQLFRLPTEEVSHFMDDHVF